MHIKAVAVIGRGGWGGGGDGGGGGEGGGVGDWFLCLAVAVSSHYC